MSYKTEILKVGTVFKPKLETYPDMCAHTSVILDA